MMVLTFDNGGVGGGSEDKTQCVNYAKYWIDQLYLIRGLVWCGKRYHTYGRDILGNFRYGHTQPGDLRSSLLLTN